MQGKGERTSKKMLRFVDPMSPAAQGYWEIVVVTGI